MLENVFRFDDLTAAAIKRPELMFSRLISKSRLMNILMKSSLALYPHSFYERDIDNIIGILR